MKLYVSDLDGTLLRNDGTLSLYSKEHLNSLINEGIHFTVASARSVVAMQKILAGVDFRLPIIEFNGSFISNIHTGEHYITNSLDKALADDIFLQLAKCQAGYLVSAYNGKDDCLYYSDNINCNAGMQWYFQDRTKAKDKRLRYIPSLYDAIKDEIVCFTIIGTQEVLLDICKLINSLYSNLVEIHFFENQYSPGWYWLTIHHKKATKDQAIRQLVDEYGFSREQLTVFGDETNDIKMFQYAANAVAMENAVPELKKYATKVIGTNEQDSVINYLIRENIFTPKQPELPSNISKKLQGCKRNS